MCYGYKCKFFKFFNWKLEISRWGVKFKFNFMLFILIRIEIKLFIWVKWKRRNKEVLVYCKYK